MRRFVYILLVPVYKSYVFFNGLIRTSIDYFNFKTSVKRKDIDLSPANFYFRFSDWTSNTGFDRHYIYHPAWAARIIKNLGVKKHIDISSTLNFSAILSAFIDVDYYDYRPANLVLNNLVSKKGDLMNLPFKDGSVESLSCMHTIEHIGLGRYGDQINPNGDLKAIDELSRVLKLGGNLLVVVPVGFPQRVCFNAHRIYEPDMFVNYFKGLKLKEFVLIPEKEEDGGLVKSPSIELLRRQKYACGCFWFTKIKNI